MTARFEEAWESVERGARGGASRAGPAARWRRCTSPGVAGRDGAVPVEHVHGHAAGGDPRRRARWSSWTATARTCACRSPTSRPRRSEHSPRAAFLVHIGGHIAFEVEQIADVLPRARDLPDRGLRPRARRELERPQGRRPTATPACTRCTRPRRSRPARAACWSRGGPRSSSMRARSATTASRATRCTASISG